MPAPPAAIRFGVFRFDLLRLELERDGRSVSLPPQPAQVLRLLLEAPGETVTRERLREVLWPSGTFVEFELGLNAAVNRLRRALGDSAERRLYIETVPKVGYRFVAPVTLEPAAVSAIQPAAAVVQEPALELHPVKEPALAPTVQVATPVAASAPVRRWRGGWALAVLCVLAVTGTAVWLAVARPGVQASVRTSLTLPAGHRILDLAISPAGDHFLYVSDHTGQRAAYRRYLTEGFSRRVAGSEGAIRVAVASDGARVCMAAENGLHVLEPDGRSRLLTAGPNGSDVPTLAWADDGRILYSWTSGSSPGVWQVPSRGGTPELLVPSRMSPRGVEYPILQASIGARHLLYTARLGPLGGPLRLHSLLDRQEQELASPAQAGLVGGGVLLLGTREGLKAAAWEETRPVPSTTVTLARDIAEGGWGGPLARLSRTGVLVYAPAPASELRRLIWLQRDGSVKPLELPPGEYEQVRLTPAGPPRLAVVRKDGVFAWSVWVVDLTSRTWKRVLSATVPRPRLAWNPAGTALAVNSERENGAFTNLYRVSADGALPPLRLTEQPNFGQFPVSWFPTGDLVLFEEGVRTRTRSDLMSVAVATGEVRAVVQGDKWDMDGQFSPDGRWLAYASGERDGRYGVYVEPFPNAARTPPVRVGEGRRPVWIEEGRALLHMGEGGSFWRVEVRVGRGGPPALYAKSGGMARQDVWTRSFDVGTDGRLLVILRPEEVPPARLEVITDVRAEMRRGR